MPAKASFTGVVAIAKVTFSVKAYSMTTETDDLPLKTLHKSCNNQVQMPYFCKYCNVIVQRTETTRGFEHGGGLVPLDENAIAALEPEIEEGKPRVFQVHKTVKDYSLAIPAKKYWLVPSSTTESKPYALFRYALATSKLAAIVTFVSHGKSHLAVLHPSKEGLSLTTVYYASQTRSLEYLGLELAEVVLTKKEQGLATHVLDGLSNPFEYEKFEDENKQRKMQVIEAVLAKKPVPVMEYHQPQHVDSLIEALEASLKMLPKKTPKAKSRAQK